MEKPMVSSIVRLYAAAVRPTLALRLSRINLTWRQSWALASAVVCHRLLLVEIRRVLAFRRWTSRATFANDDDVEVTFTRTNDGLFVSRHADGFDPRSVHTDDLRKVIEFVNEAVGEVPRSEAGWWKIR
jgi:hypothetical protein|nr:MAG TPA: hypothetical protein [Caudoviricetes sp.]